MITIDREKCIGCGLCAKHCYPLYLKLDEQGLPQPPQGNCIDCGHCVAICPTKALKLVQQGYDEATVCEYDKNTMNLDSDALLRFMQYRRSIRNYKSTPIPQAVLEKVLEAGRYSPTIGNHQTMRFVVLQEEKMHFSGMGADALWRGKQENHPEMAMFREESIKATYDAYHNQGKDRLFHGAPAVILIMDKVLSEGGANAFIAASRMELMAQSLGLGTCYCGLLLRAAAIDPNIIKELNVPEDYEIYTVLVIGYPEDDYLRTAARLPVNVEWR